VAFRVEVVSADIQLGRPCLSVSFVRFRSIICWLKPSNAYRQQRCTRPFVGIGTAGTAIVGMLFFAESTSIGRVCSLLLIALGLLGLRFFSGITG